MVYSAADFQKDTNVSRETMDRLNIYCEELIKWQKAKNLVANSSLDDLWRRHFLDSAQLAPLILAHHAEPELTIADIGAGAGFPGLVLAAMGVGKLHLIESNGRKCSFMRQTALKMGVDVQIDNERVESIVGLRADIVVSRACADISQLLGWGAPILKPSGAFWFLKGQKADDELTKASSSWKMTIESFRSRSAEGGVILRLTDVEERD